MVANGGSIKDQGIGLLILQQLNGALEVGCANDPHVSALSQLHATGALHHRNPTAVELFRSADGRFGGTGEEQVNSVARLAVRDDTAIKEITIQAPVILRPVRVIGALSP